MAQGSTPGLRRFATGLLGANAEASSRNGDRPSRLPGWRPPATVTEAVTLADLERGAQLAVVKLPREIDIANCHAVYAHAGEGAISSSLPSQP
jgi:hypothetical protein